MLDEALPLDKHFQDLLSFSTQADVRASIAEALKQRGLVQEDSTWQS